MSYEKELPTGKLSSISYILLVMLTGFLIVYHSFIIWDFYELVMSDHASPMGFLQSGLRALIVASLLAVLLGKPIGLPGMWIGISGLVACQYWGHFSGTQFEHGGERHVFSYLRGFIVPSIVTFIVMHRRK